MTPIRLRTRLAAWYAGALGVMLVALAMFVIWQQGQLGLRRVDRELDDLTLTIGGLLRDELSEMDSAPAAAREVVQTLAVTGRDVAILASDGSVLAATPAASTRLLRVLPETGTTWTGTTADGQWRVGGRQVSLDGHAYELLTSEPLAQVDQERREAMEALWVGVPLLIAIATIGGMWVSGVALRPITEMARRASALPIDGAQDLGASGRRDELGQLEVAFNGLLARLRTSLRTQRQFMADASHELRTPMSVVRATADVTLDQPTRSEAEYREALLTIRGQVDHTGRLIDDMLLLARADAGGYPVRPERVYLDELAEGCARALRPSAVERQVVLSTDVADEVPIVGDEQLLRRMMLNVLQNAVQHATGRVELAVRVDGAEATVRVHDDGPGIAVEDRERVFDRFVQLDPSRRRGGAGLGLPISRWIAEVHGGTLSLEASSQAGSTFVVRLPRAGLVPA